MKVGRKCLLALCLFLPSVVSADIFEWEWVDPADHSQGKQPSTTVVPDGAGLVPGPGLYWRFGNLTQAYLIGFDLTDAYFGSSTLTNADLSGANLTGAGFSSVTLTSANFSNAEVRGAFFLSAIPSVSTTGFTAAQLYSTASYQAGDLTGIGFGYNDMMGWNLAGKNLTNAVFHGTTLTSADLSSANLANAFIFFATLTNADLSGVNLTDAILQGSTLIGADFTNAVVRGADFGGSDFMAAQLYSSASYQAGDLTGIRFAEKDLIGWDFAGQNLTDAIFQSTTLTSVDFTNAEVRGTDFQNTTNFDFTAAQLYSTASYQTGDLTGILLGYNDLTGWVFGGKNLTDAILHGTTLTNADLSGANLVNAYFEKANLDSADLSRTDARAARDMELSSAITHNFIHPDGHVAGLDITADEVMRLWDYNLATAIPIFVEDAMSIDSAGTLRAIFEDDDWGSTLTFAAGIGVNLDGTLELLIDPREGSSVFSMVGTTFDLFDWTGVTPSGTFAQIITSAGLTWDTSNLYTTGEVTLLTIIPEPSSMLLALLGLASCGCFRR